MRILILSARFGMGHQSVSQALRQRLSALFPTAQVEVKDFLSCVLRHPGPIYGFFNLIATKGQGLYNLYYRNTEHADHDVTPPYVKMLLGRMKKLLAREKPDCVIATHPMCAQLLDRSKEDLGPEVPAVVCITDVTAHSEWLTHNCDFYMLANEDVKRALMKKGVPEERLLVTGIPVQAEFSAPPSRSQGPERRLLVMGGGLGLMPASAKLYSQLNSLPHTHTVLIAGSNNVLRRRLMGKYKNIEVLGFTNNVYDYMASSHLMLSKPGGVTLFEAISSRLPFLAWAPKLEQERRNARFLVEEGMGAVAPKDADGCVRAIRELLEDPAALARMSARMTQWQDTLPHRDLEPLCAVLRTKELCHA